MHCRLLLFECCSKLGDFCAGDGVCVQSALDSEICYVLYFYLFIPREAYCYITVVIELPAYKLETKTFWNQCTVIVDVNSMTVISKIYTEIL